MGDGNLSAISRILVPLLLPSVAPAAFALAPSATTTASPPPQSRMRATAAEALTPLGRGLVATARMSAARAACDTPTMPAVDPELRILCLHGKGGNGTQFATSLAPLRSLVEARLADPATAERLGGRAACRWTALTAPYEISPGDDAGGYAWWTLPPGVRSYNAEEYQGFDRSAAMVMEEIFAEDGPTKTCNYDIILGHSQGAILAAALLATRDSLWKSSPARPLGYILNGAAWPNPYDDALTSLAEHDVGAHGAAPRLLFITGRNDRINPPDSAAQVRDALRAADCDVSVVSHGGGHAVPSGGDEDARRALADVADWIVHVAEDKARRDAGPAAPSQHDGSAAVFVYGTLKRGFYNYEKWIAPFLLREGDGISAEQFVAAHCQSQPPRSEEGEAGDTAPDDARKDEGPIYDDAAATQRRMEEILARGPKAYLLTDTARTAGDAGVRLYADRFFVPYAVLDPGPDEADDAPLRGELYLVNVPMLGLLDELEGIRSGRYQRSAIEIVTDGAARERAFLYHYRGATDGLERIAKYDLATHQEKYVPPLERNVNT